MRVTVEESVFGLILLLVQESLGRGGGVRTYQPEITPVKYPSETRRYYYQYYIQYFTSSGIRYAASAKSSSRTVRICENYEPYFNNDTVLGEFPCPMENDPGHFTECCGESKYEFCCRLIDTLDFRLKVGIGGALALGVIIGIIVFVAQKIKGGAKTLARRSDNQRKMLDKGIPKYHTLSTSNFKASQTDDGYQILVQFKRTKFYDRLWKALCSQYVHLAWRYREGGAVKEGKVTLGDSSWVTLVLCDDVRGSPMMVVSREKSAVDWMEGPFIDICNALSDGSGGCFGCFGKTKTHPAPSIDGQHRQNTGKDVKNSQKGSGGETDNKRGKKRGSAAKTETISLEKKDNLSLHSDNRHLPMY